MNSRSLGNRVAANNKRLHQAQPAISSLTVPSAEGVSVKNCRNPYGPQSGRDSKSMAAAEYLPLPLRLYQFIYLRRKAEIRIEAASVFLNPPAVTHPDPDHSGEENREITIGHSAKQRVGGS